MLHLRLSLSLLNCFRCCWPSPAQWIFVSGSVGTHDHMFVLSSHLRILKWGLFFDERRGQLLLVTPSYWGWLKRTHSHTHTHTHTHTHWQRTHCTTASFIGRVGWIVAGLVSTVILGSESPEPRMTAGEDLLSFHYKLSISYNTDQVENNASASSSIIMCVFVAAGTCLSSRCLATVGGIYRKQGVLISLHLCF
jgi:hypothetical protein